jgi:hypothetical protein
MYGTLPIVGPRVLPNLATLRAAITESLPAAMTSDAQAEQEFSKQTSRAAIPPQQHLLHAALNSLCSSCTE